MAHNNGATGQQHYHHHQQQQPQHNSLTGIASTSNDRKQQQQVMNKVLAHSTSLLANDSYMAGMSSDSELTSSNSSNRHHHHYHRPYSSQSRVYHAHPAPRTVQTSSRMSHHSDPAGSSSGANNVYSGMGKVVAPISASSSSQLQLQQQQQQQLPTGAHLSHQGSVSSGGSGSGSGPASSSQPGYLNELPSPRAPTSRQLPQRPFKQSISIDHHSAGQYHQLQQQQQHLAAMGQQQQQSSSSQFAIVPNPITTSTSHQHQQNHPLPGYHHHQFIGTTATTSPYEPPDTNSAYQQHQPLASTQPPTGTTGTHSYPGGSLGHLRGLASNHPGAQMMMGGQIGSGGASGCIDNSQQLSRYAERQRNFLLEMEMLDQRAAVVNLNADNELLQTAPQTTTTTASGSQQQQQQQLIGAGCSPAPSASLPPTSASASSSAFASSALHGLTSNTMAPPQPSSASSSNTSRAQRSQIAPANQQAAGTIGSMSVEHLSHQLEQQQQQHHQQPYNLPPTPASGLADIQQQQQHYRSTSQLILQQQQQQQQRDIYSSPHHHHTAAAPPLDWLPAMGPPNYGHHLPPRTGGSSGGFEGHQFKQATSIDHYPIAGLGQAAGSSQHHFPAGARQSPHFSEHYRCSSLAGAGGSPVRVSGGGSVYEPANQQQLGGYHQQQLQQTRNNSANELPYHQYGKEQQQAATGYSQPTASSRQQLDLQHQQNDPSQQHYSSATDNFNHSVPVAASRSAVAAASTSGQQQQQQQIQRPKMQHQLSSGSSTSGQSGSNKSSNLDISKTSIDQQKAQLSSQQSPKHHQSAKSSASYNTVQQQQQQQQLGSGRHGTLRKGYTSVASSLAGSNLALNELLDSQPLSTGGGGGQLIGSAGLIAGGKRSALRASSPSSAYANEVSASSSSSAAAAAAAAGMSLPGHNKQQHISGSYSRGDAGGGRGAGVSTSGPGASSGGAGSRSESSTGLPNGSSGTNSSLTKKSNSATQLSMTGTKKRLGFRKKQVTSFSVYRSEEVAPLEARHLVKQASSVSEGESSLSGDSSSRSWSNSNFKQPTPEELASMSFIDGLGKGQMISRQGLASPYLGDIQLSLCDRRGNLEVEVIRARNLQAKSSKILPLTYVKLYLVKNRKCLAKAKTTLCNKRTLDPLFQQQLVFHEDYHGSILQSIVWGNFGKMDKKNFMGIAQISIDDLELNDTVISWYKLFLPSSLQTLPSKSLRHTLLSNSTESFTTNTNNS